MNTAEDINQDIFTQELINDTETALQAFHGVEFPTTGSDYLPEQRYNAAMLWLIYGNTRKVSELTNIPRNTILYWKQQEWWLQITNRLCAEKKDQFNAGFTRLVERGIDHLEKCFDNEEVSAMEAAKIMGIAFDKRQILNNQPTSISGNVSNDALKALKAQFEALAGKTIEGETISKS